ncbi:phage baseplate assembly protein [Acinetobacter piscicola]|uniref:phage baseplate assembly protein n=1 Tax=Acinetobacter piscicola TaxID=2006115 RepID=UPI0010216173|nr:hypothetical protein [Acinetobacter piscicola]RYL25156.1 hypothetical protein EWP19_13375 [Acinetobacter piscicola]
MLDNAGKEIRLIVGGFECKEWDDVTIDSQVDIPADAFSFSLYNPPLGHLPAEVKAGTTAEIYYGNELILTGIIDRLKESVSRAGRTLQLSGRDLAGQLIDCSVPINNSRQITLSTLIQDYVLASPLGTVIHGFRVQDDAWLKNKITVEPSESLYDAIAKAAQVTGQFVWMDEQGVMNIGNPFNRSQQPSQTLNLMFDGKNNNVISASYDEDVSSVFSDIKILSQDEKGQHILAETNRSTPYAYSRLKIITMSDVETQAEAQAAIEKIQHDNDLEAYTLTTTVPDWVINGSVWKTTGQIYFNSDVLTRSNAKWVVIGRTFRLSRHEGKTTELKLKREGDWAQPLIYKEKEVKTAKEKQERKKKKTSKAKLTNADLGLDEDGYGVYHGASQ